MSFWCKVLGHTWQPVTRAPVQRWFTTKEGHTLVQEEVQAGEVRHLDRCLRCGLEREARPRRHDADRPAVAPGAAKGGADDEDEDEAAEA